MSSFNDVFRHNGGDNFVLTINWCSLGIIIVKLQLELSSKVFSLVMNCFSICAGTMPVPVHFNLHLRLIQLWDLAKKGHFVCKTCLSWKVVNLDHYPLLEVWAMLGSLDHHPPSSRTLHWT